MPKTITGGHLAAKYMREVEKVRIVFTLSGGHIENLLDGFTQYDIRAIDVRHEQAAAMMAHAWSVYNNEPGVCLVTAGPGFTNALTGIANAYVENVPLVVLCGRHPLRDDLKGALQAMMRLASRSIYPSHSGRQPWVGPARSSWSCRPTSYLPRQMKNWWNCRFAEDIEPLPSPKPLNWKRPPG
jgi:hypothetical protein